MPIGSWPHVGEFSARLASAVTMHRRIGGEQDTPNHLDADGRDASLDPRVGDVWMIDKRPWFVGKIRRKDETRYLNEAPIAPASSCKDDRIVLENASPTTSDQSISRFMWEFFVIHHTFVRNLHGTAKPPVDGSDSDRPSLAQVG